MTHHNHSDHDEHRMDDDGAPPKVMPAPHGCGCWRHRIECASQADCDEAARQVGRRLAGGIDPEPVIHSRPGVQLPREQFPSGSEYGRMISGG